MIAKSTILCVAFSCLLGPTLGRATPRKAPSKRTYNKAFMKQFQALRRRALNPKGGMLYREGLFSPKDAKRSLGWNSALEALFLQGIPRSKRYDALQFVPKRGHFLLAIQIWQDPIRALRKRWFQHRRMYPNVRSLGGAIYGKAKHPSPVGRVAFFAHRGALYYLQFVATASNRLVSVSCHQKACASMAPLLRVARLINKRITKRQRKPKRR